MSNVGCDRSVVPTLSRMQTVARVDRTRSIKMLYSNGVI